jgi:hypothetical protein
MPQDEDRTKRERKPITIEPVNEDDLARRAATTPTDKAQVQEAILGALSGVPQTTSQIQVTVGGSLTWTDVNSALYRLKALNLAVRHNPPEGFKATSWTRGDGRSDYDRLADFLEPKAMQERLREASARLGPPVATYTDHIEEGVEYAYGVWPTADGGQGVFVCPLRKDGLYDPREARHVSAEAVKAMARVLRLAALREAVFESLDAGDKNAALTATVDLMPHVMTDLDSDFGPDVEDDAVTLIDEWKAKQAG